MSSNVQKRSGKASVTCWNCGSKNMELLSNVRAWLPKTKAFLNFTFICRNCGKHGYSILPPLRDKDG